MNQGPGKCRALDEKETPSSSSSSSSSNTNPSSSQTSLLSRITASVNGLGRSTLALPNNTEAISALSVVSEKGQSSRTASGSVGESSKTSLTSDSQRQAAGLDTFREGHNEEHVRQSEADFSHFLDGIEAFQPSGVTEIVSLVEPCTNISSNAETSVDFDAAWSQSSNKNVNPTNKDTRTVPEQESRDGEDVLALLSNPTTLDHEQFEALLEEEHHDWGLSSDQLSQIRIMTKELFPPWIPHGIVSTDNPLNLMPPQVTNTSINLMGSNSTVMEHWRAQWEGVLTHYTDEVWGGLLPLVRVARQESEELKDNHTEQIQLKALRRLEVILAHLQRR